MVSGKFAQAAADCVSLYGWAFALVRWSCQPATCCAVSILLLCTAALCDRKPHLTKSRGMPM